MVHALRVVIPDRLEVNVSHRVLWRHSFRVVVPEHLAEKIKSFVADELIVLRIDKFGPWFARNWVRWEQVIVDLIEGEAVLVKVGVELLGTENLSDLDELVIVVTALEEGLALEDHAGEHAAE